MLIRLRDRRQLTAVPAFFHDRTAMFPTHRPRRLRQNPVFRDMIRETRLSVDSLIYPMFVVPGRGVKTEVSAMPGVHLRSVDQLVEECRRVADLGIRSVMLFGQPESKDEQGSGAWIEHGIIQRATAALKQALPRLQVVPDLCLCEYTSHGHCGVLVCDEQGGVRVENDPTLELLARTAVSQARAGADMISPSDMMDGRVGAIRHALDGAGFQHLPIMAYSAKYAGGFYGPFREAADSAPQSGDRSGYQMDIANAREAMMEMKLDFEEGADILMVKPAMPCLDILHEARTHFDVPLAAYQVSGEYSMIMAAAERGWVDRDRIMMDSLLSIRRAGADIILTYFAPAAARLLQRTVG